jgi:hypothetical protein
LAAVSRVQWVFLPISDTNADQQSRLSRRVEQ